MKIGLLGGSFDPVHFGHLTLARAASKQLDLSVVYLMLSPQSPFKSAQNISSVRHRLAMLKLAISHKPGLKIGRFELKRKGPSYTVDTLRALKKKRPGDTLFLIVGSDTWLDFHRWKQPKKILELATLCIARRPGHKKVPLTSEERKKVFVLSGLFPDISSTEIRQKPSAKMIPIAVKKYIKQHHLYGPYSA